MGGTLWSTTSLIYSHQIRDYAKASSVNGGLDSSGICSLSVLSVHLLRAQLTKSCHFHNLVRINTQHSWSPLELAVYVICSISNQTVHSAANNATNRLPGQDKAPENSNPTYCHCILYVLSCAILCFNYFFFYCGQELNQLKHNTIN